MKKNTLSYFILLFILAGGGLMAVNEVREWMIYNSLRIWMNKTLEFKCYEVDIPKKWLLHSEKNRNGNMLYTLKRLDPKENKYVFSSITSDYENILESNLKTKATSTSLLGDTEYIVYELGSGSDSGKTSYFVKLNKKPFLLMSNKKERVIGLLEDFTQSDQSLIKFTCKADQEAQ
jgi:hypothetical protein